MKCKYDNNNVIAYIECQLPDSENDKFKEHLKFCEGCAKKIQVLTYTENYFRQDVKQKQSLADNVMADIDKNKYQSNAILNKVAFVFYKNKFLWKTVFPVATVILAVLVFWYNSSYFVDIKKNIASSIKPIESESGNLNSDSETQKQISGKVALGTSTKSLMPAVVPTPVTSLTEESDNFTPDMTGINEIMVLNKDQVIKRLGNNYEVINAGTENAEEGYRYENYGMTIIFEDSAISLIECDERVSINGAKLGMTFSEIQNILGEGETRKLVPIEPDQPEYALFHIYNKIMVWFGSMDENGVTTALQIRRYSGPDSFTSLKSETSDKVDADNSSVEEFINPAFDYNRIEKSINGIEGYKENVKERNKKLIENKIDNILTTITFKRPILIEEFAKFLNQHNIQQNQISEIQARALETDGTRVTIGSLIKGNIYQTDVDMQQKYIADFDAEFTGYTSLYCFIDHKTLIDIESDPITYLADTSGDMYFQGKTEADGLKRNKDVKGIKRFPISLTWDLEDIGYIIYEK